MLIAARLFDRATLVESAVEDFRAQERLLCLSSTWLFRNSVVLMRKEMRWLLDFHGLIQRND